CRRNRSRDALGVQLGAWTIRGLGRNRCREISREIKRRRQNSSGECAEHDRCRREVFLPKEGRQTLLLRLRLRRISAAGGSAGHDQFEISEGSNGRYQEKLGSFVNRSW